MPNRALGLDLGQAQDHTALALVEWTVRDDGLHVYHLRHLERVPLGTGYPAIAKHAAKLMNTDELKDTCQLVADATGVGRPVVDLLKLENLRPHAVVVHGGASATTDQDGYSRIPKRLLVNTAQVLLQDRRLRFPSPKVVPQVKVLEEELLKFEVKISESGSDTYGAWREGAHDDLVFALCLGCWWGEHMAAVNQWVTDHPTQPLDRGGRTPARASLIGKPTLVKNEDGSYRIERRAA